MLHLHTGLLTEVLEQPERVLQGLTHPDISLLESNANSFVGMDGIAPISQVQDSVYLEEFYSYTSFMAVRHNVKALSERLIALPEQSWLGFVLELFACSGQKPIDLYLFPFGHPMGDAYVRDVNGSPAIFVNLAIIGSVYGKTADRQFANLLPVLQREIFHVLFHRLQAASTYWGSIKRQVSLRDEFRALVLEEGIAHFVGHREHINHYLCEQRECMQKTFAKYRETMVRLDLGSVGETEARSLLLGGVVGPLFEKYLAVPGMFAAYTIYQERGIDGLRRCLEDIEFFEAEGLNRLARTIG